MTRILALARPGLDARLAAGNPGDPMAEFQPRRGSLNQERTLSYEPGIQSACSCVGLLSLVSCTLASDLLEDRHGSGEP